LIEDQFQLAGSHNQSPFVTADSNAEPLSSSIRLMISH